MKKLIYYNRDGSFYKEKELLLENLRETTGMMSKCYMNDGTEITGFSVPFRTYKNTSFPFDNKVHDYFYLWEWKNLNEKLHQLVGNDSDKYLQIYKKIEIDKMVKMECILHSNPRWGGKFTNRFEFFKK